MAIPIYTRVQLLTDRLNAEGAKKGMLGYVIEAYPDGNYEVEFSDSQGQTIAQVVLSAEEISLSPEAETE